jgi:hypothetical protein
MEFDFICDGILQGCNGLIYGKDTFMEGHPSSCFITITTHTFVSSKADLYLQMCSPMLLDDNASSFLSSIRW